MCVCGGTLGSQRGAGMWEMEARGRAAGLGNGARGGQRAGEGGLIPDAV